MPPSVQILAHETNNISFPALTTYLFCSTHNSKCGIMLLLIELPLLTCAFIYAKAALVTGLGPQLIFFHGIFMTLLFRVRNVIISFRIIFPLHFQVKCYDRLSYPVVHDRISWLAVDSVCVIGVACWPYSISQSVVSWIFFIYLCST